MGQWQDSFSELPFQTQYLESAHFLRPVNATRSFVDVPGTILYSDRVMMARIFLWLIFAIGFSAALDAATHRVFVRSYAFDPASLEIAVGDTVVWEVVDGFHNVVAANGTFRSDMMGAGGKFTHTFIKEGWVQYVCEPHAPGMAGIVYIGNPPRSVHIDGLASGATVAPTDVISLNVGSNDPWPRPFTVEFFDGTNSVLVDPTPPYELTRQFAPGQHTISAVANEGPTRAVSAPLHFTVLAGQPPAVTFTAPSGTSMLLTTQAVNFTVAATDSDGSVVRVDYYMDGQLHASSTNPPFSLLNQSLPLGRHRFEAIAIDSTGVSSAPGAAQLTLEIYARPVLQIIRERDGFGTIVVPAAYGLVTLEAAPDPRFLVRTDRASTNAGGGRISFEALPFTQRAAFFRVRIHPKSNPR
jgi:plastocyanin